MADALIASQSASMVLGAFEYDCLAQDLWRLRNESRRVPRARGYSGISPGAVEELRSSRSQQQQQYSSNTGLHGPSWSLWGLDPGHPLGRVGNKDKEVPPALQQTTLESVPIVQSKVPTHSEQVLATLQSTATSKSGQATPLTTHGAAAEAFEVGQCFSNPRRRRAYAHCLSPRNFLEVQAHPQWQGDVTDLIHERDEELVTRMRGCGIKLTLAQLPALQREILASKGWWKRSKGGASSNASLVKLLYVQLLDSALSSAADGESGGIVGAFQRTGDGCLRQWSSPWLISAASLDELTIKVAYIGCLLQERHWCAGGHAAAVVFGVNRHQRVGPFPGLCEQWFRYPATARYLELWHIGAAAARTLNATPIPLYPSTDAPRASAGPALPTRREWADLTNGCVVLGRGVWRPETMPSRVLWYCIPHTLPAAWPQQLTQLEALLGRWRDSIGECKGSSMPQPVSRWVRTAFSIALDRLDRAQSTQDMMEITQAIDSLSTWLQVTLLRSSKHRYVAR